MGHYTALNLVGLIGNILPTCFLMMLCNLVVSLRGIVITSSYKPPSKAK